MAAICPSLLDRFPSSFWRAIAYVIVFVGLADVAVGQRPDGLRGVAENERPRNESIARLIRVPLPITGSDDTVTKRTIDRIVDSLPRQNPRPILILEFQTETGRDGSGSEFERCLSLANYLSRLTSVRSIAWIRGSVFGHAVLPALACEEIVVASDAMFGDAGRDSDVIGATVRRAYVEISENRRTVPAAVALGMLDKKLKVLKITTNTGVLYALEAELNKIRQDRIVQAVETLFEAGVPGVLDGQEMRELGFASYLAADEAELAAALKIPLSSLEFDPSLGGDWQAIRVELRGLVTESAVDRTINTVQQQLELGANFVCLYLDSEGGDLEESSRLANFLADVDDARIRTVAFVPNKALADSAIIAFACDHVVARKDAVIGGSGPQSFDEEQISDSRFVLKRIAERKSDYWSVPAAMIDPDLDVYAFRKKGQDRAVYLCDEELRERFGEDAEAPNRVDGWIRGEKLTTDGEPLQLDGERAEEIGFVRFLVDDFDELRELYRLASIPELQGPNWAFQIVEILATPQVAAVLLMIGILSLYIELSSPGLGIGGFVGTLCFALYFWSNFMHGTAEVLEILLFVLGIIFVCLEVFVIPGFGIFGLGGGALILLSLVLATQTFMMPTNKYQTERLTTSMLTVFSAIAGVFVAGFLLRRYLPHVPFLGRVVLTPPASDELARRESIADYSYLLGQRGRTTTRLSPAGKAMFGDDLIDVISQGEMIDAGTDVVVVEAMGNRVVVERAN